MKANGTHLLSPRHGREKWLGRLNTSQGLGGCIPEGGGPLFPSEESPKETGEAVGIGISGEGEIPVEGGGLIPDRRVTMSRGGFALPTGGGGESLAWWLLCVGPGMLEQLCQQIPFLLGCPLNPWIVS